MWIIFDLDDTLIDTWGKITPWQMERALRVVGRSEALFEVLSSCPTFSSSKKALLHFGEKEGIDGTVLQKGVEELYAPLPENFEVPLVPHAKEILDYFSSRCPIALVTAGREPFQRQKWEKAGIDATLFRMIVVCEEGQKKGAYAEISSKMSLPPQDLWVCGDRIWGDLEPARQLGAKTVHVRRGRGLWEKSAPFVTASVADLRELKDVIR